MLNQKKYLFVIFIFCGILLSSCSSTNDKNNEENVKASYKYTLKPTSNLEIPVDSMTNFISEYLDYYEHPKTKEQYLVWLNSPDSHIHFYNLKTKKRDFEIPFQDGNNGTDAVGELDAFIIKNLDTIIVISKSKDEMIFANFNGKVLHNSRLKVSPIHVFNSADNYKRIGFLGNDKVVFHKAPFTKVQEGKAWTHSISFTYDYKKSKYDSIYKYTGELANEIHSVAHTRYAFWIDDKGNYIYSMCMDKNLQVTNYNKKLVNVWAASKYDTKKIKSLRLNNTDEEDTKYFLQTTMYKHIIYDKFRDIYYRFALHPIDDVGNKWEHGKPFSIIILDKNFQIIGESDIFKEKGIYYYTNFFVAPEGLYISNNHEDNPNLKEDLISFKLFKFLPNE